MTKIISICNHKGGVGKSSTASAIGSGLAKRGYRTLLIDLDAQANLTSSFFAEELEKDIYQSLSKAEALPIYSINENLDLVPSSLDLATIELELSGKIDNTFILQELIEPIKEKYKYIVIDCPPSIGLLTINALVASTDLYIPLMAEVLPTRGLNTITENLERVQKRANKGLKLSGIVFTRWGGRNINKLIEEGIRKEYGDIVFNTRIRENIAVAEAPLQYQDIYTYAPTSNGAKDYTALVEEILSRS